MPTLAEWTEELGRINREIEILLDDCQHSHDLKEQAGLKRDAVKREPGNRSLNDAYLAAENEYAIYQQSLLKRYNQLDEDLKAFPQRYDHFDARCRPRTRHRREG